MIEIIKLARQACKGEISHEQFQAANQMRTGKEGLFKNGEVLPVADINGKPMIAGKRYKEPNKGRGTVLVTRATYGAGNVACTYYRVWYYYGEEMEEGFTLIDGKGSVFNGFDYPSKFEPID